MSLPRLRAPRRLSNVPVNQRYIMSVGRALGAPDFATGRGAGVARTFGVGEAGGSNPLVPTNKNRAIALACRNPDVLSGTPGRAYNSPSLGKSR
jgi:hypothetical protein